MQTKKSAATWLQENPLYRVLIMMALGIVAGEAYFSPLAFPVWVWWVLLAGLTGISVALLWRSGWRFSGGVWATLALSGGFFVLGVLLTESAWRSWRTVWPEGEAAYRVMVMDDPREAEKVWRVRAKVLSGAGAGREVQLILARPDTAVLSGAGAGREVQLILARPDTAAAGRFTAPAAGTAGEASSPKNTEREAAVEEARRHHEMPLPGDELLVWTQIRVPRRAGNPDSFDYAAWLRRQGVSGKAYVADEAWQLCREATPVRGGFASETDGGASMPWTQRLRRWRGELVHRYSAFLGKDEAAIAAAMTLGDRREIDSGLREVFSRTGTNHILALSGLHLSILFALYGWVVLRACRRRWTYLLGSVVGVALLWGFTLLTAFPVSLVRAAIMLTVMQGAACLRRQTSSLNNLALAALLLLLISPWNLFDIGFQLSFLSVFSIIMFARSVPLPAAWRRFRWLRALHGLFSVSLVAQLGTAPLVAYYFQTVSLVGLLANFVVVPFSYVILTLALCFFLIPCFGSLIAGALGWSLEGLLAFLEWLSALPFSSVRLCPDAVDVVCVYLLLLVMWGYVRLRRVRLLYGTAALLVAWVGYGAVRARQPLPRLVVYHNYSVPVVHALVGSPEGCLWTADSAKAAGCVAQLRQGYWARRGVDEPRLIVAADSTSFGRAGDACVVRGHVIWAAGLQMVCIRRPVASAGPAQPAAVDVLLLARGSTSPLSHLRKWYRPQRLVLDASLGDYWREKYRREAAACGWEVYDVSEQGALEIY